MQDLIEVARDPIGYVKRHSSEEGRPLSVTNSSLFPLELLDGLGFYSVWLPPVVQSAFKTADRWIQVFMCANSKSFVDIVGSKQLPIKLVGVPIDCDAKDVILGVLDVAGVDIPELQLKQPIEITSEHAPEYMYKALKDLIKRAESLGLTLNKDRLIESCKLREMARERLRGYFKNIGDGVDPVFAYSAAVAYQVMPPEDFLKALPDDPPVKEPSGPRMMLSGAEIPSIEYIKKLQEFGVWIVADDTDTGSRSASVELKDCEYAPDVDAALQVIARALIERRHGPTKAGHMQMRVKGIVSEAIKKRVSAVVFLTFKFCDPHAFEIPGIIRMLEGAGIKNLVIEVEKEKTIMPREANRIQTLVESITQ